MIAFEWTYQIERQLPFTPTEGQHEAIVRFSEFMATPTGQPAFVMRGSAGTGKTSVARAIVSAMGVLKQKVVLLAPTGRAAKVLSMGIERPAFTIHRRIYRQKSYMAGQFTLNDNLHTDTLFLVDEASMINHGASSGGAEMFGSGSLLDDLVRYVYAGRNCRLMLIGDTAQLPPVGCDEAPALMTDFLSGYGLQVFDYDLVEVLRQAEDSGILYNATRLRYMITYDEITALPRMTFKGFADISICPGTELIDQLGSSYSQVGHDETIVITRSNKRANIYNMGIRNQVLWYEDELGSNDQLMIVKNNYYWTNDSPSALPAREETSSYPALHKREGVVTSTNGHADSKSISQSPPLGEVGRGLPPAFLANGDRCVVRRVRNVRELYGFHFADVLLQFPDYPIVNEQGTIDGYYELQATVLLDTLHSEAPVLTHDQQEQLFNNVIADYADLPLKQDRYNRMRQDCYFNALQVKYAYAVTCHKAQGGQWQHVYLDQGYMTDDMLTPSYIHWLYTAFTRATSHLYLVNWPKEQVESE